MNNAIMQWQGGKCRLADNLNKALDIPHEVYVEPFVGSGGLFLNRDTYTAHQVINDLDEGVYSLWKTLRGNEYKEFAHRFCELPLSPNYFDNFKIQRDSGYPDNTEFQKALIFYYLTVYSFNGDMKSMGYKNNVVKHREMKEFAEKRLLRNIENAHLRAKDAHIYNRNALSVINEYKDNHKALIYIDSPYVYELMGDKKDLYNIRFSTSDQVRMMELIRDASAKICISGYRGGSLLYDKYLNRDSGWHTYLIGKVTRSAGMYKAVKGSSHNIVSEFIWTNYELPVSASYHFNSYDFALSRAEIDEYLREKEAGCIA